MWSLSCGQQNIFKTFVTKRSIVFSQVCTLKCNEVAKNMNHIVISQSSNETFMQEVKPSIYSPIIVKNYPKYFCAFKTFLDLFPFSYHFIWFYFFTLGMTSSSHNFLYFLHIYRFSKVIIKYIYVMQARRFSHQIIFRKNKCSTQHDELTNETEEQNRNEISRSNVNYLSQRVSFEEREKKMWKHVVSWMKENQENVNSVELAINLAF